MTSTDTTRTLTGEETLAVDGVTLAPDCLDGQLSALVEVGDTLERLAADRDRSDDDFVLEAPGPGGWVAWQQGDAPLAGTLRSVANVQRYAPAVLEVAERADLTHRVVEPRCDGRSMELYTAFLWAKPARVGSQKPWHQDMAMAPRGFAERVPWIATLWVAIDEATADNGCLEFARATHLSGCFPHVGTGERTADEQREGRAVEPHIEAQHLTGYETRSAPLAPGSGVLFDGMTVHRSRVNTSPAPRRAMSFVFIRRS